MLTSIHPKLPFRSKSLTQHFYLQHLGFSEVADYSSYLIFSKDHIELHFFEFKELNPKTNYGQVYIRTSEIEAFYHKLLLEGVPIHPNSPLEQKPWGQQEFALLDPDNNLLTFGQSA